VSARRPDRQESRSSNRLAHGLSNKRIAQRLVISRAAGNHIEHIYTKIDASNRAHGDVFCGCSTACCPRGADFEPGALKMGLPLIPPAVGASDCH